MSDSAERLAQQLTAPLFTVDLAAELAQLREAEGWRRSGRSSRTLVKEGDLRVVLIALRAGARLEEHLAPGRITIHTLNGHLTIRAAEQTVDLPAGQVLTLARAIPHDVEATEESAFLLTIAWPH